MIKILLLSALLLFNFIGNFAFANCPSPETIVYKCAGPHKMCTWQPKNGWYQGSGDDDSSIPEGTTLSPNAFNSAVWVPYRDDNHGATNCYYVNPKGKLITLFQQTGYGSVPAPKTALWNIAMIKGYLYGFICIASASHCQFEFGERS